MTTWTIRLANSGEITQILDLYNTLFPDTHKSMHWWSWWYEDNPAGRGAAMIAVDEKGMIGGVLCMTPVKLIVDQQTILVAQDSVGLVHPTAQRQGLFGRVAEALHLWEAETYPFQFCFCNEKSKLAYIKHLQSKDNGAGAFYTSENDQGRLPGDAEIREIQSFGQTHDVLWESVKKRCRITQVRDSRYWNWRFATVNSGKSYLMIDVSIDGKLHGTLILQPYGDKLDLLDYLWRTGDGLGDLNTVLNAAKWIAAIHGYRRLSFWCLDSHLRSIATLTKCGFLREKRDFHLLSRRFNEHLFEIDDFALWECTAADLELF